MLINGQRHFIDTYQQVLKGYEGSIAVEVIDQTPS